MAVISEILNRWRRGLHERSYLYIKLFLLMALVFSSCSSINRCSTNQLRPKESIISPKFTEGTELQIETFQGAWNPFKIKLWKKHEIHYIVEFIRRVSTLQMKVQNTRKTLLREYLQIDFRKNEMMVFVFKMGESGVWVVEVKKGDFMQAIQLTNIPLDEVDEIEVYNERTSRARKVLFCYGDLTAVTAAQETTSLASQIYPEACPVYKVCPEKAPCPECETCPVFQVSPEKVPCSECVTCPVCQVYLEKVPSLECEAGPVCQVCPEKVPCPEFEACPVCQVCPEKVPCPGCEACPICQVCPEKVPCSECEAFPGFQACPEYEEICPTYQADCKCEVCSTVLPIGASSQITDYQAELTSETTTCPCCDICPSTSANTPCPVLPTCPVTATCPKCEDCPSVMTSSVPESTQSGVNDNTRTVDLAEMVFNGTTEEAKDVYSNGEKGGRETNNTKTLVYVLVTALSLSTLSLVVSMTLACKYRRKLTLLKTRANQTKSASRNPNQQPSVLEEETLPLESPQDMRNSLYYHIYEDPYKYSGQPNNHHQCNDNLSAIKESHQNEPDTEITPRSFQCVSPGDDSTYDQRSFQCVSPGDDSTYDHLQFKGSSSPHSFVYGH